MDLAGFLRGTGSDLVDRRAEGRHTVFVFRARPSRREDVRGLYGDAISVRLRAVASTIKDRKGRRHNA